jgi:hypothetical protein
LQIIFGFFRPANLFVCLFYLKFDLSQQKVKINGRTAPEVGLLLTIDDVEKFVDGVALLADRLFQRLF